jgi:dipeptidyl aminopeptidase/acylaminoacyl peptidase
MKSRLFPILVAVFAFFPLYTLAEELPPVEAFFKNPEFSSFELSPDGKSIAMLAPFEGYMNLYVYDLENREPRVLTGESLDVTDFFWANNERLVYSMNQFTFGNYESRYRGGLFSINKDGSDHRVLVEPLRSRGRSVVITPVDILPEEDRYILVTNNERRREHPDIFKLDVYDGSLDRVFNNPARINNYYMDDCGIPRFGFSFNEDARVTQMYRPVGSEEWLTLEDEVEDFEMATPVFIPCDGDTGLVSSNTRRDTRAIYRKDFRTGVISEEPVLKDDTYDIEAEAIGAITGQGIVGIRYEAAKPEQVYFEETHAQLQGILDQAIPDAFNEITSVSDDGQRLVIRSFSEQKAPEYYLLHMDGMRMEPLAKTMPSLENLKLGETRIISYEARDGRTIHGYLTLPPDYEDGERVPLIINPHGGPWARDTWGLRFWFDYERQFLASRGFAVLRINFRGSTGYGKEHLEASFKNLEAMHHDVIDGVRWAISEGIADKDKVGIGGASWGGYATMTALVKNPEMFQFGINVFGVVDIIEQIKTYRQWDRDEGYEYWIRRIGDPSIEEDRKQLEEWSAINYIDRIDDPVFIYHGVRDFNVDVEQSRMLARALRSADKDYKLIIRTDEAHSAFDEENRIDLYREIDAFLKEVTAGW